MATKNVKAGEKRKASSAEKAKNDTSPKKTKLGRARKAFEDEEHMSDDSESPFSDQEDGGVPLKKQKTNDGSADSRKPNSNENPATAQTSRESHAKQKQLAQERKAAKPLADEVHRTKKIWERLRLKSHVPKDERQKLVNELFEIITGQIKDFVLKHDATRAIQTAIKYSTPAQRKQIARELQGAYVQLAESRYAKFLIGKLLVHNDNEIRDLIIPEFYGKVRKLINHPEASWILDDIYRTVATKQHKATMLREWYGTEFVIFKQESSTKNSDVTADLAQILEAEPSKRGPILKYLQDMINQLVQKKMTGFTMLHDAMLQCFLNLKPESEEGKEFVEMIKEDENGDLLKNMAFTKSGARLVCLLLAHGSSKDRRQILKTYKDVIQVMCGDNYGHQVILAAYEVIDDTVMTSKAIFPEILGSSDSKNVENIIFCANDLNARTTILYLFEGASKSLFPASLAADLEMLAEVHEIRKTTSKKQAEIRRRELVAALSGPLLAAIATVPADLVSASFGCQFVTDVLLSAEGDKSAALEAIASTAGGDPGAETEESAAARPHVSRTPFGSRMLKTLIVGGKFDKESGTVKPVDPPLNFADIIYPVIKEHIVAWATGPGSFVPLALLESDGFSHAAELRKMLGKNRKALEKVAREETAEQRAKREALGENTAAAAKDGEKGKKKKGKKAAQETPVGNFGAKLLLEKL